MPQTGVQRVKTGCRTCKARRVKCDEAKPVCQRCTSTRRQCQGYEAVRPGSFSWDELLSKAHIFVQPRACPWLVDDREARALDLFKHIAAPTLPGGRYSYFWTKTVLQAAQQEPAVRHAVLAIGSFFEDFAAGRSKAQLPLDGTSKTAFSITQYNASIRQVFSSGDKDLTLFACLLYVALEYLVGDIDTAMNHVRHGIRIVNNSESISPTVRESVLPTLFRLSIFQFFFGKKPQIPKFPTLKSRWPGHTRPFTSMHHARLGANSVILDIIQFICMVDRWQDMNHRGGILPQSIMDRHATLKTELDEWFEAFRTIAMDQVGPVQKFLYTETHMKYIITKIWLGTCLTHDESAYDCYREEFQTVVSLATKKGVLPDIGSKLVAELPPIVAAVRLLPLIYFVVVKCRHLDVRLAALVLMGKIPPPPKAWYINVESLCTSGRKIIELEHDIDMGKIDDINAEDLEKYPLPSEDTRLKGVVLDPSLQLRILDDAAAQTCWRISFLARCGTFELGTMADWISTWRPTAACWDGLKSVASWEKTRSPNISTVDYEFLIGGPQRWEEIEVFCPPRHGFLRV